METHGRRCLLMLRNSLTCGTVSFERWDGSRSHVVAPRPLAELWHFSWSGDVGSLLTGQVSLPWKCEEMVTARGRSLGWGLESDLMQTFLK